MPDGETLMTARETARNRLRDLIREKSLSTAGTFSLSSGKTSGYFFDMKTTMLHPEGANLIADILLEYLRTEKVDAVGGLVMGAVPIISVVCAKSNYSDRPIAGFFVRKEAKGYGTNKRIEGNLTRGMTAILIDDVTTTGSSLLRGVQAARDAGCRVDKVLSVVDRREGAEEALWNERVALISIFNIHHFIAGDQCGRAV